MGTPLEQWSGRRTDARRCTPESGRAHESDAVTRRHRHTARAAADGHASGPGRSKARRQTVIGRAIASVTIPRSARYGHSERSEESRRIPRLRTRFFAALRMTGAHEMTGAPRMTAVPANWGLRHFNTIPNVDNSDSASGSVNAAFLHPICGRVDCVVRCMGEVRARSGSYRRTGCREGRCA